MSAVGTYKYFIFIMAVIISEEGNMLNVFY